MVDHMMISWLLNFIHFGTNQKLSTDHQVIEHFRKKSLFFQDTRDHQEHDAKNLLSIPGPSSEKPVAEIARIKKIRP